MILVLALVSVTFVAVVIVVLRATLPTADLRSPISALARSPHNWPPTRMFLDQYADADSRLTMVGVNWAFLDMFELWRERADRAGVRNYVVLAYDRGTFEYLLPSGRVLLPFDGSTAVADFGSDAFRSLTRTRPGLLRTIMDLGYTVFYSDIDTVYRRNPYGVFDAAVANDPDLDVIYAEDGCEDEWCSCLLYLRSRPAALDLVRHWSRVCFERPDVDDQGALNIAVEFVPQMRTYKVPDDVFPTGRTMFQVGYDWEAHPDGPVIVHANWMIGLDKKMEVLRNTSLWDHPPPPMDNSITSSI